MRMPPKKNPTSRETTTHGERGSALVASIFILALLGVIAMTVLGVVTNETRIAGSDLQRTRTFYAAASGMEKMTTDFSALFSRTSRPTLAQLSGIAASFPPAAGAAVTGAATCAVGPAGAAVGGATVWASRRAASAARSAARAAAARRASASRRAAASARAAR